MLRMSFSEALPPSAVLSSRSSFSTTTMALRIPAWTPSRAPWALTSRWVTITDWVRLPTTRIVLTVASISSMRVNPRRTPPISMGYWSRAPPSGGREA